MKKVARFINYTKHLASNPVYAIGIVALVFLLYTIAYPLWEIVSYSFQWHADDLRSHPNAVAGQLTAYHWQYVLFSGISTSVFYKPLLHSSSIAVTVSLLSLFLGGVLAWLVVRTDLPCKKIIGSLIVIPYMIPSWIKAFAWLIIFKNGRIGGSRGLWEYITGTAPPDSVSYGFLPISIILSEHSYMYFYLLLAVALSSINVSLEETAEILGASRFAILRKITLPLITPAICSGLLLTFTASMGNFGTAALLGLPVKYYTISTMLYNSMNSRITSTAYVLGIILILISSALIYFNQKMIGKRKSFVTIGGKSSRSNLISLGRWKIPAVICVILFLLASGVFPLLLLIWQSLMKVSGNFSLSNLTLHYWIGDGNPQLANGVVGIFKNEQIWRGISNSLQVSLFTAAASSLLGLILGYAIARGRNLWLSKTIEQLAFLPYLIPGISFAAIYLVMFAKPHPPLPALYGTMAIIILISVVNELPFATRAGTSTMLQIGDELEEAAKIQGSSWFRSFFRMIVPISRKSLISAFLISFISAMKELELIIMLVTPKTSTLTTLTFSFADKGYPQFSAASVLVIIAIILGIYFLAVKLFKADLSKGIGS